MHVYLKEMHILQLWCVVFCKYQLNQIALIMFKYSLSLPHFPTSSINCWEKNIYSSTITVYLSVSSFSSSTFLNLMYCEALLDVHISRIILSSCWIDIKHYETSLLVSSNTLNPVLIESSIFLMLGVCIIYLFSSFCFHPVFIF